MSRMPDCFVDLTVTSPPYDNLRKYKGFEFDFEAVARELYRVTKVGGVVVWVVGDATIKGSETGTSFKQALYFMSIGFNLHDTMIYRKNKFAPYDPKCKRYYQEFEYMFVLTKGKINKCNYIYVESIHKGKATPAYSRSANGSLRLDRKFKTANHIVRDKKIKANIWDYANINKTEHPAPFPEQLATDHIKSWSNEGDLVYDPFMGSGTTAISAHKYERNFIGSELSEVYTNIANERLANYQKQLMLKI